MHFDESFWVAAAFAIFVALVASPISRFITSALDKRAARIKQELDEAVRLKEEAQALLAEYQRKQKRCLEEADEIIDHARGEAERIVSSTKARLEEELARRTEVALQKIAQTEARVVEEIRDNAVDITISTARRVLADNLGADAAEEIVGKAISGMDQKLH